MEKQLTKVFKVFSDYDGQVCPECTMVYDGKSAVGASAHVMMVCRGLLGVCSASRIFALDGDGDVICDYKRN